MSVSGRATANPVRKHRREVWLRIIAPVLVTFLALVGLCVALGIAVGADALSRRQITVLMSVVATAFIALPMALLCLVPYFLLASLASLAGKGYANAQKPIRSARHMTERIATAIDQRAPTLAQPLIALNTRVTQWEHTLNHWLPSALPGEEEISDD